MKKHLLDSLKMLMVMCVLTGLLYPLFITFLANIVFPRQAGGSLITINGKVVGSKLIGQSFSKSKYFWPRPSAIGYNPLPSGGSNYAPTNDTLKKLVEARKLEFIQSNNLSKDTRVPSDMLYASASGLDPDISFESAELQVNRIARVRGFNNVQVQKLRRLVLQHLQRPEFGFLGDSTVNVLELNISLDSLR